MMDRETLIEQCLLDAEKGYLVDESMMSWIKGKTAAASQAAKNIGTSIKNGAKNIKAGYKNTLGKMAGGSTHDAAKQEASNIKASRGKYGDVSAASKKAEQEQLDHENKVARAKSIKKAGAAREKAENKAAKTLKKAANKALSAIEEFKNAGGVIKHGRTNAMNSVLKALKQAAGVNEVPAQSSAPAEEAPAAKEAQAAQETPAEPTAPKGNNFTADQLSNAPKTKVNKTKVGKKSVLKKPRKNPYAEAQVGGGDEVEKQIGNSTNTAEWEETVNRSVTAVHENSKHFNTPAQLKMLDSIH